MKGTRVPTDGAVAETPSIVVADLAHPIWLIRHAPTSWTGERWCGRADPALTPAGAALAEAVARALAVHPDFATGARVLSSPARRASATADAIAAAGGWTITRDADLLEVDVGLAEGLTWAELEERFPKTAAAVASDRRSVDWPGGETTAELDRRARRVADRIVDDARAGPVIAVSHGALLSRVSLMLTGRSDAAPFGPGAGLRLVPAEP